MSRAFSLTEVLAVLGILAVLAAILLPMFFNAHAKAPAAQCTANLRQIGVARQSYVQDYDGTYPPTSQTIFTNGFSGGDSANWYDLIAAYTGKPFPTCPGRIIPPNQPPEAAHAPKLCGYGYNVRLNESLALNAKQTMDNGLPENSVRFPSLTVAVFDCRVSIIGLPVPDADYQGFDESILPGGKRHQKGGNYLFTDGHVKWYLPSALRSGEVGTPYEHGDGIHPGFGL